MIADQLKFDRNFRCTLYEMALIMYHLHLVFLESHGSSSMY